MLFHLYSLVQLAFVLFFAITQNARITEQYFKLLEKQIKKCISTKHLFSALEQKEVMIRHDHTSIHRCFMSIVLAKELLQTIKHQGTQDSCSVPAHWFTMLDLQHSYFGSIKPGENTESAERSYFSVAGKNALLFLSTLTLAFITFISDCFKRKCSVIY